MSSSRSEAVRRLFAVATFIESHRYGVTVNEIFSAFPEIYPDAIGKHSAAVHRKFLRDMQIILAVRPIVRFIAKHHMSEDDTGSTRYVHSLYAHNCPEYVEHAVAPRD